jgi:hypothetical protein
MGGVLRRVWPRVNGRKTARRRLVVGAYEKIVKAATNISARLHAFEEVKT